MKTMLMLVCLLLAAVAHAGEPAVVDPALENRWNDGYVTMLEAELIKRNVAPGLVRDAYTVVFKVIESELQISTEGLAKAHAQILEVWPDLAVKNDGFVNQVVSCKMCHADNRNEPSPH